MEQAWRKGGCGLGAHVGLIGVPPATAEELLPLEIAEWLRRWRNERLTLAQAKTRARHCRDEIAKRRGERAAAAWWAELLSQSPKLG